MGLKSFLFVPFDRTAETALFLNLANILVPGSEMENRVELRACLNGNPKASQIHRPIDRQLLEPKLLRGDLGHATSVVIGLVFERLGRKDPRRESHRLGLLAADSAAGKESQVLGAVRTD